MGAVPAGSLCKWTNPESSCLYPLGEPRRRCAEPPPWKTPALAEAPRALSAVCYTGRPGVEDTIPRETVPGVPTGGQRWSLVSSRGKTVWERRGALGACTWYEPHRGAQDTRGAETVP